MSGQGRPGDVLEFTVLKKQPRSDEALLLLKKIASVSAELSLGLLSVRDGVPAARGASDPARQPALKAQAR
jgi:hypothetical protein